MGLYLLIIQLMFNNLPKQRAASLDTQPGEFFQTPQASGGDLCLPVHHLHEHHLG